MRQLLAPAALMLSLHVAAAAAADSDHDPYSGAPLAPRRHEAASPITDHFYARASYYVPQIRTELRVDPSGPPGTLGTPVNAENVLGLARRLHRGTAEFMFRLRERSKVRLHYFETERANRVLLANDLVFGDQTFLAGQQVQSLLQWRQFDLTYTYSLLRTRHFELGTGLGLYFLQVDASGEVPATNQRQEVTAATPFPALPLDLSWALSSRWAVTARGAYLKATLSGFRGWYADLHEDLQYRWNPDFSLGLGFTSMRASVSGDSGSIPGVVSMSFKGPEAFIRFSY